MRGLYVTSLLVLSIALVATACKEPNEGEKAKVEPEAPATPEKPAPKKQPMAGAPTASSSVPGKSNPLCVGPIDLEPSETRKAGAFEVTLEGYKATFAGKDTDRFVVGVIGDIKEDTGENLFNLGRYVAWFKERGVEAVFMTGDTSETDTGIARVLDRLAEPGWPVFAIVGNREAASIFADGVSAAQEKHPNVFSLNKRRLVSFPMVSFLSLPGYHDARFLHAEDGCLYHTEDVDALEKVALEVAGTKVLVSHGPPRGATKEAIDVATEAGNVGDANINGLIQDGKIAFGFFGNIQEAGGKATDLLGKTRVPEKTFVRSFYLNVGPADAIRWLMNDGSESTGMAAVVTFKKDGAAAYEMKRLPPLTEAEQAEADKLDPAPEPAEPEAAPEGEAAPAK